MADESAIATGHNEPFANLGNIQARAPKKGLDQSDQEKQLVARVAQRISFSTRESSRWALERQIFENVAFQCGLHWIDYSENAKRFTRWNAPAWFPTPVSNYIAPNIQIMQAALMRSRPSGRVRPSSNDPRDREGAAIADQLIPHIHAVTREERLRFKATLIASVTGTVIVEDYFNTRAGQLMEVPRMQLEETPITQPTPDGGVETRTLADGSPATIVQQTPVLNPDTGEPLIDLIPEGEIESRVRPLFNFYWDPKATTLEEARWCGEAMYVDLDWIDENFPERGPYVAAEEGIDAMNFYESSLLALVGPSSPGNAHYGGTQYFQNGVVLRKYQEKPSQLFPQGLQLYTANDILLWWGALPLKDHRGRTLPEFTYSEWRYDEVPGRFAGRTPTDDMVPLNKRVNGIDAGAIINRKTLGQPWVLAPKGSGLEPGRIAMRPGATVLYNFIGVGASPQVVHGTPLPAYIMDERKTCVETMSVLAQDSSAQQSLSSPTGMKSGILAHFQREIDGERRIPRLESYGQWLAQRDRKRLLLAQYYYREPRAVKIAGPGEDHRVRYFLGADLAGNTDIVVDPGSLMPMPRSVTIQKIFDGIDQGWIDPVNDPIQRQRLLEEVGMRGFETDVGPDYRMAQKEIAAMDSGMPMPLTPYENKAVHLALHINRVKDPSFNDLAPEAQQAHLIHIQETQAGIQEEAEAAKAAALRDLEEKAQLIERVRMVAELEQAPTPGAEPTT